MKRAEEETYAYEDDMAVEDNVEWYKGQSVAAEQRECFAYITVSFHSHISVHPSHQYASVGSVRRGFQPESA